MGAPLSFYSKQSPYCCGILSSLIFRDIISFHSATRGTFQMQTLVLVLLSLFFLQTSYVSAFVQCYYPDGSIPTDFTYVPCTSGNMSACCIQSEGDVCQPNGLCYYPPKAHNFRGACTDQTWASDACPKICISGKRVTLTIISLTAVGATSLIGKIGYEHTWSYVTPCDSNNQTFAFSSNPAISCEARVQTVVQTAPVSIASAPTLYANTGTQFTTSTSSPSSNLAGGSGRLYSISDRIALGCGIGIGLPAALA